MASFLDLPPEICDQIIEHVLYTTRRPPISPQATTNRKEICDSKYATKRWKGRSVFYEQDSLCQICLPLLLANRQLALKTQAVISRMRRKKQLPAYQLDMMFMSGLGLFPTWLSVPWPTNRIETFHVHVRLFGPIIPPRDYRGPLGNGGRVVIHWHLYRLLKKFVRSGPVGEQASAPPYRDLAVSTLILDFSRGPQSLAVSHDEQEGMEEDPTSKETCQWVCDDILRLLHMGYHRATYGKLLYDSIGSIRMLVDGQLWREINLTKQLVELHYREEDWPYTFGNVYYPPEDRIPVFRRWKAKTLERRTALGF